MARFYGKVQGHRGEATRLGRESMIVSNNGWDQGVRVEASGAGPDEDFHYIVSNGGSGSSSGHGPIATILGGKLIIEANALLKCENLVQSLFEADRREPGFIMRLITALTEPGGKIPPRE